MIRFDSRSIMALAGAATSLVITGSLTLGMPTAAPIEPGPPQLPTDVRGKESIKTYLLAVVSSAEQAGHDLKSDGQKYADLCAAHGSPAAAAAAEPDALADLIVRMRNDYKRIDSYGYEYIEGIVAGVPQLMKYDVELDSGVPEKGASAQDQIAYIHINAGGIDCNKEGSLNNFLIEPTVYGTNPKFTQGTANLPGFGKPTNLPNPQFVLALADYAIEHYGYLHRDSQAWQPTDRDLFQAMVNMTPTLADYFDDWKESKKYGQATGGRFVAVSRVSDMRGIMASTRLNWEGMEPQVQSKDPALASNINKGYQQVMYFIDTIDARDAARPLNVETIDALGTQAKERADKLTVQVSQAAAELGIDTNGK